MKSVLTLNNVKVILPGNFKAKFSHTDAVNTDRIYNRLKWTVIIAIPVIIAIAYYVSTHGDFGNILG